MEKLEFQGKLSSIPPSKIMRKERSTELENFFLILAMIYNDLKGLIYFQKLITDHYRKPNDGEISVQTGEYSGLITQTQKYIIATVNEFFVFLKKSDGLFLNPHFLLLLKKLNRTQKSNWARLLNPEIDENYILSKIARIRSNVSFHFDHSADELRKGFIENFYSGKDLVQNKKAFFSLGSDMESSRFYYADASVAQYINLILEKNGMEQVNNAVDEMNMTIQALLEAFINESHK